MKKTRPIKTTILPDEDLAAYLPERPLKPLKGLAHRVHAYVSEWLRSAPQAAVLPFVTIESGLGISGDYLRSLRHNSRSFNAAMSSLGLEEVARTSGRAVGYRRHVP